MKSQTKHLYSEKRKEYLLLLQRQQYILKRGLIGKRFVGADIDFGIPCKAPVSFQDTTDYRHSVATQY